ncbi:TetR/AcrR family transcriptional regulator [Sphingomonas sp. KC8]|nr:TetR/AcrR family transcriptional regulator C-terminal ligand-binding domain-containing protein [Sphingomonas sp. KC8]ARS27795.1 TetR family transcriptional regulator [Sphingomonas sp. KC8]
MTRGTIRPGGRTEKVRRTVASTVLELIKDGATEFTIVDVVQRSGIARSTIYARWPTREALIAEALTAHNSEFKFTESGDWQADLHQIARSFFDFAMQPNEIAVNSLVAYMGSGFLHQETWRQWYEISHGLAETLRRAQAAGEIREGVNPVTVITTILTTITALVVIAKQPPTEDFLRELVDVQIAGCAVRP